jgi:ribosome biogenesis GTPase
LINDYGWSDPLQQAFAPHAAHGLFPGRVVVQQRGLYRLATDAGEVAADLSGRFMHTAAAGDFPVTGDWVAASETAGAWSIQAVLPRRGVFRRKAAGTAYGAQVMAANVDLALLVAALNADFNPRRLERYLAAARSSGARCVVALTKADLCRDLDAAIAAAMVAAPGERVIAVSALTGEGLPALADELQPGQTAVLVGSSGAGKSTLVNTLAGAEIMLAGAIREDDGRGRHTTTHRELVRLPSGALLLDTPGMRELGLWGAEEAVTSLFEDVQAIEEGCRFRDCTHEHEPGCAVRGALESGELDPGRWAGWRKLQKELAFQIRREDPEARAAHRRKWVRIHKANRIHSKRRWDD